MKVFMTTVGAIIIGVFCAHFGGCTSNSTGVTDAAQQDVTDAAQQDVTDAAQQDVTDAAQQDVTDAAQKD